MCEGLTTHVVSHYQFRDEPTRSNIGFTKIVNGWQVRVCLLRYYAVLAALPKRLFTRLGIFRRVEYVGISP